ncbi:hypothetical protein [Cupriavidus basilensis]|uniref:hypothetical protein n=1 Tax=Cupriavidus basilensis TaxID=68895 RepID=UPI000695D0A7|nr:hypothetical protein [Cupriavidus basilensis]
MSQQTDTQALTASAQHPDDAAVDRFAVAMKAKMAASRAKGRGGWDDPAQCPPNRLAYLLMDHVPKGDPVDVGNFAMMLFNRPDAAGVLAKVATHGALVTVIKDLLDVFYEDPLEASTGPAVERAYAAIEAAESGAEQPTGTNRDAKRFVAFVGALVADANGESLTERQQRIRAAFRGQGKLTIETVRKCVDAATADGGGHE